MDFNVKAIEKSMEKINDLFAHDFKQAITYGPGWFSQFNQKTYYDLGFCNWLEKYEDWLDEQSFKIFRGETKVCIIDDENEELVFKIGFIRSTNPRYVEYNTANDYSKKEADYYIDARAAGLEQYFAATFKVGECEGVEIFAQERTDNDEDLIKEYFVDYVKSSYNYDRSAFESDEDYSLALEDDASDLEGEERIHAVFGDGEEIEELIEFIDEREINDLHSGNWGKTKDGRIVMFDYSGYDG